MIARDGEIVERLERSVEREGRESGQVAVQAQRGVVSFSNLCFSE